MSSGTLQKTNNLPSDRIFKLEGESRFEVQVQVLRFIQGIEVSRVVKIDRQPFDHPRSRVDLGRPSSFDLVPCGDIDQPDADGVEFV